MTSLPRVPGEPPSAQALQPATVVAIPVLRVVGLIPAHNEPVQLSATTEALIQQERPADLVVVISTGCADDTAVIARGYQVMVLELPVLPHKKSEALNVAWGKFCKDADVVICLDGDTVLPPNAIGGWELEFLLDVPTGTRRSASRPLGGSSSKFTMLGGQFLTRMHAC